jgi:hypothetical protein
LVIFCVALVAAMRTRMSLSEAIRQTPYLPLEGGGRRSKRVGWGSSKR